MAGRGVCTPPPPPRSAPQYSGGLATTVTQTVGWEDSWKLKGCFDSLLPYSKKKIVFSFLFLFFFLQTFVYHASSDRVCRLHYWNHVVHGRHFIFQYLQLSLWPYLLWQVPLWIKS